MKIIHLSTYDINGGAARSAYRLHAGLLRLNQDSSMFVAQRNSNDLTVTAFRPRRKLLDRLCRFFKAIYIESAIGRYRSYRPQHYEIFSNDRSKYGKDPINDLPAHHIINLHWIAEFIDYSALFSAAHRNTPIIWTLHDMNPFTGGCHYTFGCDRYTDCCGACPQLGSNNPNDLSHRIWKRKKSILMQIKTKQLHIVTPSHWLAREVERSSLLRRFPKTVIPYGLNTDDFAPRDRDITRKALGIPSDVKAVLFVANDVNIKRKGFSLLVKALNSIDKREKIWLVSLGNQSEKIDTRFNHVNFGSIENDRLLAMFFSAVDIFVIPSLQDNLPNTVLESLACGTPIVGFRAGGIPDMVRDNITGLLVSPEDTDSLGKAIEDLLKDSNRCEEMAANCYRIALAEYNLSIQAQSYISLYEKIYNIR